MTRKPRIVTPSNPGGAALIDAAGKAGSDIYGSDTQSLVPLRNIKKPELFLNIIWGPTATNLSGSTDAANNHKVSCCVHSTRTATNV
jgi:hypothetical protein